MKRVCQRLRSRPPHGRGSRRRRRPSRASSRARCDAGGTGRERPTNDLLLRDPDVVLGFLGATEIEQQLCEMDGARAGERTVAGDGESSKLARQMRTASAIPRRALDVDGERGEDRLERRAIAEVVVGRPRLVEQCPRFCDVARRPWSPPSTAVMFASSSGRARTPAVRCTGALPARPGAGRSRAQSPERREAAAGEKPAVVRNGPQPGCRRLLGAEVAGDSMNRRQARVEHGRGRARRPAAPARRSPSWSPRRRPPARSLRQ